MPLAFLNDPGGLVEAAKAISQLTHYEDQAWEACAVWCLMIRHTVVTGEFPTFGDIEPWVPNSERWRGILAEAEAKEPSSFAQNGWSVGALQAAWSAITHTAVPADGFACRHVTDSLTTAIRIGHDTDTVAAIAGAMLGARWGMSAIPAEWRRILHGWPGVTGKGLEKLGYLAARNGARQVRLAAGRAHRLSAPPVREERARCTPLRRRCLARRSDRAHELPEGTDAVVSLCLTGRGQVPDHVEHINYRLMDEPDPEHNPNLDFILVDAAQTVARLRDEGKTVVLHCVAAHSRTPAVGIAYAMLRGVPLAEALPAVCSIFPAANPNSGFRRALSRLEPHLIGLH